MLSEWALDAYWSRLVDSADERQALIDALVVPETWFFREREAFTALARIGTARLAARPDQPLRVLSAPCASGEEPYSATMALLDAGCEAGQFGVDAIDISAAAIDAAVHGVYGRNAFRGDALAFRERHFEAHADGWRIGAAPRQCVRFERANLFDWLAADGSATYDFVFCRNVLIYFDREAQDRAIGLLRARLAEGGMIFVGPAETGLMMRHEMVSASIPLAFGFRLPDAEAGKARVDAALRAAMAAGAAASGTAGTSFVPPVPPVPPRAVAALLRVPGVLDGGGAGRGARQAVPAARAAAAPDPTAAAARTVAFSGRGGGALPPQAVLPGGARPTAGAALAAARKLADAGRLDEAAGLALEAVHDAHYGADAWYLLGLIADAQGRATDAHAHYRKAVYLEPAHYEALTHLAALLEMQGDAEGARQLRRRADRAAPRRPGPGGADA